MIFKIKDCFDQDVIFTKKKFNRKKQNHPELLKKQFIKCVQNCLAAPDEVWPDYSNPANKKCYYKKYSQISYAKVVVWFTDNPAQVVTAFEINYIKEKSIRVCKD
ncbi:hypothetical protein A2477_02430 [Candidatus Falkowbacteria bacterium RIFOXYC2_FULL_47_12]|uniref:Phage-Barnase-EndoU-ColicinE5/D-RelE like nuclease 2 domain-containing protein n=2 Tax=Candidatus Falkowiibacteriota TaxID=1752728 RepID=A0A1F5TMN7_9BACT|nr:MAG: hypothetical protein A2242_00720 [Candidatus Falkowbacteria bacterium RIFOXYA2_FULL_47_9]OGF40146.1 MAG: hypothetical protein A2477_02430 [Candidatus Falkowbacteria bacterium RIFOXYC2_FULL_47_12]